MNSSMQFDPTRVVRNDFVLVSTREIGQDMANDLSSIVRVSHDQGANAVEMLLENTRLPLARALALANAYAISEGIETVWWARDQTYSWA